VTENHSYGVIDVTCCGASSWGGGPHDATPLHAHVAAKMPESCPFQITAIGSEELGVGAWSGSGVIDA